MITAKELASKLGLSATAVSMALNNKPGVSTETRMMVLEAAERYGYDFTRIKDKSGKSMQIYVVTYRMSNAILSFSPVFDEIMDGIQNECGRQHIRVNYRSFIASDNDLDDLLGDIRASDADGVILIASEMDDASCRRFDELKRPIVLLDNEFISPHFTCVCIDNAQGAYDAVSYLIKQRGNKQPGYLQSSYKINNFTARAAGCRRAFTDHGMSVHATIRHELPPTIEGAYMEMASLLEAGVPIADSYFADNDLIAIGAMKAFKKYGHRIPEDVGIVGFDDISASKIVEPQLTTMRVPRSYMGEIAVQRLERMVGSKHTIVTKTLVSTSLVTRFSV